MIRKVVVCLLVLALGHVPCAVAEHGKAAKNSALNPNPSTAIKTFTGDLDGMLQHRVIRALVVYSKTQFYVVRGRPQGISHDALKAFEAFINKKFPTKSKHVPLHVIFIPVSRDQLLPMLVAGKGDIAVGALTVTPERQKVVAFTEPTARNINE